MCVCVRGGVQLHKGYPGVCEGVWREGERRRGQRSQTCRDTPALGICFDLASELTLHIPGGPLWR